MNITINGQRMQMAQEISLCDLISQFCKDSKYIIAELNGSIIKNQEWCQHSLKEGDAIELVSFVGGG